MNVYDQNGRLTVNTGDFTSFGNVTEFTLVSGLTLYFGDSNSNIRIKYGQIEIKIGSLYYPLIGMIVNGEPVLSLGDGES